MQKFQKNQKKAERKFEIFGPKKVKKKTKLRILTQKWPERVKIDPDAQIGV